MTVTRDVILDLANSGELSNFRKDFGQRQTAE